MSNPFWSLFTWMTRAVGLLQWLAVLTTLISRIAKKLTDHFGWIWVILSMLCIRGYQLAVQAVSDMSQAFSEIGTPGTEGYSLFHEKVVTALAFANSLIPVGEIISLLTLCCVLLAAALVVRVALGIVRLVKM